MAEIEFLRNQANKVEGLAYAGFETFRGSPYTSCARETGQNSRDAAVGGKPVRVGFNLLEIPRAEVPFASSLQHSIECCLARPHDEKTRQHLARAQQTISARTIKVLEISDLNTTGLTGPIDDPNSVFAALVKGDGVTNKSDPTSAGSFGIGKNAAYAVSDLQTVIYSSRYVDASTNTEKFAAQGRLRLISHVDGARKLSAEGYWGNPGFEAIENENDVPNWMRRSGVGTSIYSVGFREQEHWVYRMSLSLITNFFAAIDRREIEFSIGNRQVQMNQSTLDSILVSVELRRVAQEADQLEELERAQRLLNCIRSEVSQQHTISVAGLGDFTLHLLVAEDLPREVHVLRNGIYITDSFAKFGQPMKRFPGTREFSAVLEPARTDAGRKPSQLLKQLENPEHTALEPERIVDPIEHRKARSQIKELISKVREIIRETAKIEDIDRSQLDELSHLFADGGVARESSDDDQEKDPDHFRYGTAQPGRRTEPPGIAGTGPGRRRRGPRQQQQPSARTGQGRRTKTPAGSQAAVPLKSIRSNLPSPTDGRRRVIYFTPSIDGEIELTVQASGLSTDPTLNVVATTSGRIANGHVRTHVKDGERTSIEVRFAESFAGPIELSATTTPGGDGEA